MTLAEHEMAVTAAANGNQPHLTERDIGGRFLPGWRGGPGRPRRGESFQEIAANLSRPTKRQIIAAQVRKAKEGDTRAFAELRDTAEGKPATRVVIESSSELRSLLNAYKAIDAEYEVKGLTETTET